MVAKTGVRRCTRIIRVLCRNRTQNYVLRSASCVVTQIKVTYVGNAWGGGIALVVKCLSSDGSGLHATTLWGRGLGTRRGHPGVCGPSGAGGLGPSRILQVLWLETKVFKN